MTFHRFKTDPTIPKQSSTNSKGIPVDRKELINALLPSHRSDSLACSEDSSCEDDKEHRQGKRDGRLFPADSERLTHSERNPEKENRENRERKRKRDR